MRGLLIVKFHKHFPGSLSASSAAILAPFLASPALPSTNPDASYSSVLGIIWSVQMHSLDKLNSSQILNCLVWVTPLVLTSCTPTCSWVLFQISLRVVKYELEPRLKFNLPSMSLSCATNLVPILFWVFSF